MVTATFGTLGLAFAHGGRVRAKCQERAHGARLGTRGGECNHYVPAHRVRGSKARVRISPATSGLSQELSLRLDQHFMLKSTAVALAAGAATMYISPSSALPPLCSQAPSATTLCLASLCSATFFTTATVLWMTGEGMLDKDLEGKALAALAAQFSLCAFSLGMFGLGSLSRLGALACLGGLACTSMAVVYAAFQSEFTLSGLGVGLRMRMQEMEMRMQEKADLSLMQIHGMLTAATGLCMALFPGPFARFALSDPLISKSTMLWMSFFGSGVSFLGIIEALSAKMPADANAKVVWSETMSAILSIAIALQAISQQLLTAGGSALLLGAPIACLALPASLAIKSNPEAICSMRSKVVEKISAFRRDTLSPWISEEKVTEISSATASAGSVAASVAEERSSTFGESTISAECDETLEGQETELKKVEEDKSDSTVMRPEIEDF